MKQPSILVEWLSAVNIFYVYIFGFCGGHIVFFYNFASLFFTIFMKIII